MTEQTKAVFENPQLLREKLGEYLDTTKQKTIEHYAVLAEKMFEKGDKKKLKMRFFSWNWAVVLLWIAGIFCEALSTFLLFSHPLFAICFMLATSFLPILFLFYRGCTKRAIFLLAILTIGNIISFSKTMPMVSTLIGIDILSILPKSEFFNLFYLLLPMVLFILMFVAGIMYLFLPLYASQYVVLKFGQSLDKDFKKADGKKDRNVIIVIAIYIITCVALYLFIDSYMNKSMSNFHGINAEMNNKNYTEQTKSIQNNNVNDKNKNEQSAAMIEQNTQINHLLLVSDDEFCESGRAWLSYKSLLKHDAKIDKNIRAFYEEIKSVDDVPANTISNKGSVVICSFEGPNGMSVEYINKKVNKILSEGEWVEINEYEKTYELDERVYKFTAINKQEVQKAIKTTINNMKLITNDLIGFRSAGFNKEEAAPWSSFTTADLYTKDGKSASAVKMTETIYLSIGDTSDCIEVNFNPNVDEFTGAVSFLPNSNASGICKEVLKDSNVKQYFKSFYIGAYGE